MSILIGADFVPTESNETLFIDSDLKELLGEELLSLINKSDFRIFNLELPLCDEPNRIRKCGPNLRASSETINAYKSLKVDLFTLANNHIMDQSDEGLFSTIKQLTENQIAFVGAGENLNEASKGYTFDLYGKKIGVYACAEHEFSICSDSNPGANPYDPLFSFDHIVDLKDECDYVIVLYHGGKEHYRYPSPNLQKVCRRFIDKGADLVVCQHSHCIGSEEKYNGGVIVYGQGNFLFDHNDSIYWQTGLLIKIDERLIVDYVPIIKNGSTVRLADEEKAARIIREFQERSTKIKEKGFIESEYESFSNNCLDTYLNVFSGKRSFIFRAINKASGDQIKKIDLKKKYDDDILVSLLNYIECEAHSELLIEAIKKRLLSLG